MAALSIPARLAASVAALFASSAAGCGGQEQAADRTVTANAAQPIEVVGTEYAFDPSTVVVEGGGGPIEITLDNRGSIAHNLMVFEGETEVGGTDTFQGGESDSAEVDLGAGSYRLVCTVADHEELGMVGEIEVR